MHFPHEKGSVFVTTRTRVHPTIQPCLRTRRRTGGRAPDSGKSSSPTPVVRMLTTATKRRGRLSKRLRSQQSFRSVLSMDVEYNGFMPNLKISARNTLQVTGAQDLQALGHIFRYLVTTYNGRGFRVNPDAPSGFVGDVVLANVHFKMSFRLDRAKLRDRVNAERTAFIASYEPLVRDVSVSLKYMNKEPLPNGGSVYPRWDLCCGDGWGTVTAAEARQLVPHINLKSGVPRVTSLRVFQSGSVIIVSRWPTEMALVHSEFVQCMDQYRAEVVDSQFARQRTLESCWRMASNPSGA